LSGRMKEVGSESQLCTPYTLHPTLVAFRLKASFPPDGAVPPTPYTLEIESSLMTTYWSESTQSSR
jgi:hypothetical protein